MVKRVGGKACFMKKIISLFISVILGVTLFSQQTGHNLIQNFLNSEDYLRFRRSTSLHLSGQFDIQKSSVSYIDNDNRKILLTVVFSDEGRVIYTIEAPKKLNPNILLPNDGQYLMLLRDFSNYESATTSGVVKLYDLNYAEFHYATATVEEGNISSIEFTPVSEEIRNMYSEMASANAEYIRTLSVEQRQEGRLCDYNNNGNITWGECFRCFHQACQQTATCILMCYIFGIGNVPGLVLTAGVCNVSIVLACTYIAIVY
jgi:hypothetical protein